MRGYIRKRSNNSYAIQISTGWDPETNKYQYYRETVKGTKKDAEKRLSELLHQKDIGSLVLSKRITFAEYLNQWIRDYAKAKLSQRSYDRYKDVLERCIIPVLGNIQIAQLSPNQLQRLYSSWLNKGLSPATVLYHHHVIHTALQSAVKWQLVGRNVSDAVEIPKERRPEMQTWNEDEITQFLSYVKDSPYYALFYTALFTGMRRGELLALQWPDIDLLTGQISVNRSIHQLKDNSFTYAQPKSERSRRTIALTPSNIHILREYQEKQILDRAYLGIKTDSILVFSTIQGEPIRPNTVTRAWHTLAQRAGVKVIRLHDARHAHASILLKQGIHPKVVQERLGHASIEMTLDLYSHVAPGMQEAAAANFDKMFNKLTSN